MRYRHVYTILGLELGNTDLLHYAVMRNILGPEDFQGRYRPISIDQSNDVFLKMYLKDEAKPQRKMGHINVIDVNDKKDVDSLIKKAQEISAVIKFESSQV